MESIVGDSRFVRTTQRLALVGVVIIGFSNCQSTVPLDDMVPADAEVLRLPYLSGETFCVWQTFFGTITHHESYAVDIGMPVGTKLVAVRDGTIWRSYDYDDVLPGKSSTFDGDPGNFLTINHGDGTAAVYVHIQKDGVLVWPLDKVKAGDVIALSGNTGNSTNPHLHFQISRLDGTLKTVPFRFRDKAGDVFIPRKRGCYTAE